VLDIEKYDTSEKIPSNFLDILQYASNAPHNGQMYPKKVF